MNGSEFAVRDYRAQDQEGVLSLLRQSLGNGRAFDRTNDFWQWKHFRNPFGASLLMVAVNSEAPVGLRAFMRWRFRSPGRVLSAVRAVDTATHPASRRSGVFATLTGLAVDRAQHDGVDLIFNTPNRFSLPGYLKLGWRYVGRPHLLVKVLRPDRIARALLNDDGQRGEAPGAPGTPAVPAAMWLSDAKGLDPLLEENDRLSSGRIRTDRSTRFLRWRYADAPSLPYYACQRESGRSSAVAIFRPNRRRGLREIMLSELLLGSDARRSVGRLIGDLRRAIEADYMVAHAPRGSRHWWILLGLGFLPVPRIGPYFTVRPLSPAAAAAVPERGAGWWLSLGDLEVF
ncbi:MAG: GNAT family N-acetyltransferase [bacterium]